MNNMSYYRKNWLIVFFVFIIIIEIILYFTIPETASAEYNYTIEQIFKYMTLPCLLIVLLIFIFKVWSKVKKIKYINYLLGITGFICIFIAILSPDIHRLHWIFGIILSLLWIIGTLALGLLCFKLIESVSSTYAAFLSILGTVFLLWGTAEIYFLLGNQTDDGKYFFTEKSKYVLSKVAYPNYQAWIDKKSATFPIVQPPLRAKAEAVRRYTTDLYDMMATYDEYNHRTVPINPHAPKADLLLFGCSYTFGHGLNNEQTWPWKLSIALGSDWKLSNYAVSGFGAQQMLGLLEEHELEPVPKAPVREALFLSIRHHIHRYTGIFYKTRSLKYVLDGDKLIRKGYNIESPLHLIASLPYFLNGSQTARELSMFLTQSYIHKFQDTLINTYAAIIIKSSKILREEYNTRLSVLLWPDIEDLAPMLEKEGIPILFARTFLTSWDTKGETYYHIVPNYEVHPNEKATDELAAGLAAYYRKILDYSKKDK